MYKQQSSLPAADTLTCPECGGRRFRVNAGKVVCTNCDWTEKRGNKYGAKRQVALDGIKRDSKYEAAVADELRLRKLAKDIKDYDSQYKIEVWCYRADGTPAFKVSHKVDFRIHHNDGSYELLEAKGVETPDYQWRRKFLENIWLPEHPDHTYTVVKQGRGRKHG
jgi:uncharacterized Zn finger protein (UPF0148 family)